MRRTAIPWPFCTTTTVIASGTTSSIIACQDQVGVVSIGCASHSCASPAELNLPAASITTTPTINAPRTGGTNLPSLVNTLRATKVAIIGRAITASWAGASTKSVPK